MMQHSVFRLFWTLSVPGVVSARQTGPRWLRITLSEKQRTFIHTLPHSELQARVQDTQYTITTHGQG